MDYGCHIALCLDESQGRACPRRIGSVFAVGVAIGALAVTAAWAADVEAFLSGTARTCIECDLEGRDLKERDFKRAKLDRANLKGADLSEASLFRASLVRAQLTRAVLKQSNLNLVDAKWADFSGAAMTGVLLFEADLSGGNFRVRRSVKRSWAGRASIRRISRVRS